MATLKLGAGRDNTPVRQVHEGNTIVISRISLSVSWSVGDVAIVGKLPVGAKVLDVTFLAGTALGAANASKLGTSASAEAFLTSATYTSVHRTTITSSLGSRSEVSLSDDAIPRFQAVVFGSLAGTGLSVGYIGDVILNYTVEDVAT